MAVCAMVLGLWTTGACDAGSSRSGGKPQDLYDFQRLCEDGGAFADAPAYAGPGPHPIVVFPTDGVILRAPGGGITEAHPFAAADTRAVREPTPGEVQLVACQQRPEPRAPDDKPLATCAYDAIQGSGGWATNLYPGRYRLTLREARTGRQVGEVLATSTAAAPGCSDLSSSRDGATRDSYTPLTWTDYHAALHGAITEAAR